MPAGLVGQPKPRSRFLRLYRHDRTATRSTGKPNCKTYLPKTLATFHQIPSQKGDQNPAAFPTTWYTRSKPRVANPTFSKPGQRFERERGTRRRETRLFACDSLGASKRMSSQLLSLTFESLFFFRVSISSWGGRVVLITSWQVWISRHFFIFSPPTFESWAIPW